jgi:hypothetical protein
VSATREGATVALLELLAADRPDLVWYRDESAVTVDDPHPVPARPASLRDDDGLERAA